MLSSIANPPNFQFNMADMPTVAEQLRTAREARQLSVIEVAEITCEGEPGQEPIVLRRAVTASVGAASLLHLKKSCRDATEVRQLLIREADKAMYVAKAKGKNCVHWAPDEAGELPPLQARR